MGRDAKTLQKLRNVCLGEWSTVKDELLVVEPISGSCTSLRATARAALAMIHPVKQQAKPANKEASRSVSKAHRARSTCLGEHCRSTDPFCSVEGLTTKLHELLSKRSMSVVTRCYAQRVSRGAAMVHRCLPPQHGTSGSCARLLPARFIDCL